MIATLTLAGALTQAPALPVQRVIANPASVYCVSRGGRVEIVNTKKGQIGICVLPDGRRIEEWKFFRASRRK
ncbi:MAG TPA: DUF333 domain-containing protein [Rhodoblastus sp.]|nr:DUF333 domain-containing protein [Rhodoblastus sp.]